MSSNHTESSPEPESPVFQLNEEEEIQNIRRVISQIPKYSDWSNRPLLERMVLAHKYIIDVCQCTTDVGYMLSKLISVGFKSKALVELVRSTLKKIRRIESLVSPEMIAKYEIHDITKEYIMSWSLQYSDSGIHNKLENFVFYCYKAVQYGDGAGGSGAARYTAGRGAGYG